MLNPVWLNTFTTLIDTGSFTKTADKLFMTQPGVSQHINKLELACGHDLIRRNKKRFEISEQGRLVYTYARSLKKHEEQLFEQLDFDDPQAGICSASCSGAVALQIYPKLLELQTQHPELVIRLKAAPNQQIQQEILSNTIGLGIVTDKVDSNKFDVQVLGKEELYLVFPSNTDINIVDKCKLLKQGMISHPDAEHYLAIYFAQCKEPGFQQLNISDIPVTGFINQIAQILEPVAQGLGFTVLPKSAVANFYGRQHVQIFKPAQPVLETLYLIKKKHRQLPARYQIFIDNIEKLYVDSRLRGLKNFGFNERTNEV